MTKTRDLPLRTILDAAGADGAGTTIGITDFKHAVFAVDSASSANMTIKFQGSVSDTAPAFASAQSATNQWETIEVIDLQSGTPIDGDTGIALSGTDDHRMLEANINGLKWINVIVSSFVAGTMTVKVRTFTNQ